MQSFDRSMNWTYQETCSVSCMTWIPRVLKLVVFVQRKGNQKDISLLRGRILCTQLMAKISCTMSWEGALRLPVCSSFIAVLKFFHWVTILPTTDLTFTSPLYFIQSDLCIVCWDTLAVIGHEHLNFICFSINLKFRRALNYFLLSI